MITQTIHEIQNPFDVYVRELGYSLALFLIAGSVSSNPQFIVRIYHSGQIRVVDQNDVLMYGNPTTGEQLIPDIPDDWIKPSKAITLQNQSKSKAIPELSDDEIEKAYNDIDDSRFFAKPEERIVFIAGAKWYRKQLKQRQ